MKIHEYQAKALLDRYGIRIPRGKMASTPASAKEIATEIDGRVMIKAQVYAGGRGKAGGVRAADTPLEAEREAGDLIGSRLVTHQTGPGGVPVTKVLVAEANEVARELYLGLLIESEKATRSYSCLSKVEYFCLALNPTFS